MPRRDEPGPGRGATADQPVRAGRGDRRPVIAAQHRAYAIRLDRVVALPPQQAPHVRVHRGLPQLLRIHLAQALVALAAHGPFGLLHEPGHGLAEVADLLLLLLVAFAATRDGLVA